MNKNNEKYKKNKSPILDFVQDDNKAFFFTSALSGSERTNL
ncbi:hypothetical protein Q0V21_31850 [Paenibacillus sp. 11B]|nr:hypothetical protein [Paenibacillus sp. 11B]MDN8593329.1 hypothetical protein [Paenibacillus sp. 11B]